MHYGIGEVDKLKNIVNNMREVVNQHSKTLKQMAKIIKDLQHDNKILINHLHKSAKSNKRDTPDFFNDLTNLVKGK